MHFLRNFGKTIGKIRRKGKSKMSEKNTDIREQDREDIVESGSITAHSKKGNIHCITIAGQIEGHMILPSENKTTKYEHVCPQLAAIEESDDIDGLLILLNTVGGDIEAGLAIAELISSMNTPTVSLILGGGHSIGVPLAVSAKKSFIAPSAAVTIHPVRMNGVIVGTPQTYNYFERVQERIVAFVSKNSNIKEDVFRDYMLRVGELATDVGSVIYGEEAVQVGLIDSLGGLSDALDYLHEEIAKRRANEKE